MANARLKLARQTGKKRRRNSAQSDHQDAAEMDSTKSTQKDAVSVSDERFLMTDAVQDVLLDRKLELETRLNELTLGKSLAKLQERGFDVNGNRLQRTHRDFLLQEMEWMAADFAQERKWRIKSARLISMSVVNHHSKMATKAAREKKMENEAKRRLAAKIGRDVKKFWTKIDKIISFKVKLQSDELRKAAMDRHLKQLISQTERYSSALADTFLEAVPSIQQQETIGLERKADEERDNRTEIENGDGNLHDVQTEQPSITDHETSDHDQFATGKNVKEAKADITTIIDQESSKSYEEVADSSASQQPLRTAERRARRRNVEYNRARHMEESKRAAAAESRNCDGSDSDFQMESPEGAEEDDEETIERDERMITREEIAEEVSMLEEEGEMSIEELRARYSSALQSGSEADSSNGEEESTEDQDNFGANDEDDAMEYEPIDTEESDNESTINAAETDGPSKEEIDEEVQLLQEESEMSINELRARYAKAVTESNNSSASDDDFSPNEVDEVDDEHTIEIAETTEFSKREVDEEVKLLNEESDMPIEEVRARNAHALDNGDAESSGGKEGRLVSEIQSNQEEEDKHKEVSRPPDTALLHPAIQSSGYKRPYLLTSRLSLREYQEAGVNWLISMCEKRINGILADEMGLGKTIQTITMLAHLACARGLWGPHLIVVPTSCLVNWEMEFKRWCPAFKVLTYFGSAKRRKELRQGWSKHNAFQICITSYQLVVQDAHCFKRKKWYYLILDEAHNIKNWKSLRWQTLLNFNSQRRLLLTGTPLQNNIMELWALMHFLMPHVFASRKEFTYWFQNPLAMMVEGEQDVNTQLVAQLHGIIRPFVLRRLKKDVAKQMPEKYEHVIKCKLSKRQRFLYEDFISRSSTRRAMRGQGRGANFMSMMNVLMQLRKVCNHPDLFEPRPIASPLDVPVISIHIPSCCGFLVDNLVNFDGHEVSFWNRHRNLPNLELAGCNKFTSQRCRQLYYYDMNLPLPSEAILKKVTRDKYSHKKDVLRRLMHLTSLRATYWRQKRKEAGWLAKLRVEVAEEPMLGEDLIRACTLPVFISHAMDVHVKRKRNRAVDFLNMTEALNSMVKDPEDRVTAMTPIVTRAICYVPKARTKPLQIVYEGKRFSTSPSFEMSSNMNFPLSRKQQMMQMEEKYLKPIADRCLNVYYEAFKRTQLFFPDKRLLQFDCGKLQQLDILLRELKRGNHRCLIFTQMSSMLNILEIFLNIHGHTYFRLDGSTKVEKRQMLMERFNHDEKIFCFILSTRSGGLGINLTGADCVIFYDSDWNPAMDAQAQDRAHRIGQTRDVHIYRLICEHTVEENILKKAQQKRHLDFLVMAEGQFTTDFFSKANLRELVAGVSTTVETVDDENSEVDEEAEEQDDADDDAMSYDAIENAMAQLEDEEDVVAMKGAREEFLSEQREFDEEIGNTNRHETLVNGDRVTTSKPSTPSSVSAHSSKSEKEEEEEDNDDENSNGGGSTPAADEEMADDDIHDGDRHDQGMEDNNDDDDESIDDSDLDDDEKDVRRSRKRVVKSAKTAKNNGQRKKQQTDAQKERASQRAKEKAREKQIELEEEKKLQAWKDSVSSLKGFEDSLNPVDRYALHFREEIDPLYAYVPTAAAMENYFDSQHELLDIEKIEAEKMAEEASLIAEGELLAGFIEEPIAGIDDHHAQLYRKERAHVHFERRKRLLTGSTWQIMKCAKTNHPFYYNTDTREAIWDRPSILIKNEQFEQAMQLGYAGLIPSALLLVMKYLSPYPDRHRVQLVCKSWCEAANHQSLFRKLNANDLAMEGQNLSQIIAEISYGESLLFGSGVYQLEETLRIDTPIKLVAAPDSHVELQMSTEHAQLQWAAKGGMICGFHLSRYNEGSDSKITSVPSNDDGKPANWQHLLHVVDGGCVRVVYCDFDGNNQGNACAVVSGSDSSRLVLQNNRIYHGGSSGILVLKGELVMNLNSVYANSHSGVSILGGNAVLRRNKIYQNGRFGIRLLYHANNVVIEENVVNDHPCGNIDVENSGRRFVIRWNDMNKDEPDHLPHVHGRLRINTFHIMEQEIVRTPSSSAMTKVKKLIDQSTSNTSFTPVSAVAPPQPPIVTGLAVPTLPLPVVPLVVSTGTSMTGVPALPMPSTPVVGASSITIQTTTVQQGDKGELGTVKSPAVRVTKPKMEKVLGARRVLTLQDTCDKRVEKVKKPRLPKQPTQVNTAIESLTVADIESKTESSFVKTEYTNGSPASQGKTSLTETAVMKNEDNTKAHVADTKPLSTNHPHDLLVSTSPSPSSSSLPSETVTIEISSAAAIENKRERKRRKIKQEDEEAQAGNVDVNQTGAKPTLTNN